MGGNGKGKLSRRATILCTAVVTFFATIIFMSQVMEHSEEKLTERVIELENQVETLTKERDELLEYKTRREAMFKKPLWESDIAILHDQIYYGPPVFVSQNHNPDGPTCTAFTVHRSAAVKNEE